MTMNTKTIMILSAVVMGAAGIALLFIPQEIHAQFQVEATEVNPVDALILQLMGAMYFGFAMINWTAKANLIGGIYGRPIAIGNVTHFTVGALGLLKGFISSRQELLLAPALIYLLFAIGFTVVFFTHPVKDQQAP
jgi:hypothetical protein